MAFKQLTRKEKVEFIWDYYKLHIIGAAVALFFIGSLLNHYIFNPPKPDYVVTAFYGIPVFNAQADQYDEALNVWISTLSPGEKSQSHIFSGSDTMDMYTMAEAQKFMALIAAGELDIMILNRENYAAFREEGLFDASMDAIPLEDVAFFDALGIDVQDAVAVAIGHSKRKENALNTLRHMTGETGA